MARPGRPYLGALPWGGAPGARLRGRAAATILVLMGWVALMLSAGVGLMMSGCGCTMPSGCAGPPAGPVPDDQILASARDALAALVRDRRVDERTTVWQVDVTVAQGRITLTGKTSSPQLKGEAVGVLRRLPGVREVVDAARVLPDPALGDRVRGVIRLPVVNLGDAPGQAEGKHTVTQAVLGMVVDVLEEERGWYRVRMWDDYLGWVDGGSLVLATRAEVDAFLAGKRAVVTARMAPVLAAPVPGGREVYAQQAVEGTELPCLGEERGWVRVGLPGGGQGFIAASQVRVFPGHALVFAEKKDARAVIATAHRYLGLPYLWGGTTGYGFDCSGLTQFAFRVNGWRLPRDADMQYGVGTPVDDRGDLLPGDLVFFTTYKPGPSHVGIYMGGGRFIHSGSRGVAINSLDPGDPEYSSYLSARFLGGRRIIPSSP